MNARVAVIASHFDVHVGPSILVSNPIFSNAKFVILLNPMLEMVVAFEKERQATIRKCIAVASKNEPSTSSSA
ncbi:hypothetical protein GCK72_016405 [Caenorhabditis remanei]|uniref:Uncharacterized protein n=1 Tax=Caenorhabditis remanei TaxID=31234 RepID=A0A6A5G4I9_CAERE|nr:hypothetical protein GCK72_016405 [Caenorhabditis remanei]KAF1749860.1 hypothetical protein GCK72_016405 [Caenorhabditis remanei]